MPLPEQDDKSFPLAEALIIFLIVVVVAAMLAPTLQRTRRDARQSPPDELAVGKAANETGAADSMARNARKSASE